MNDTTEKTLDQVIEHVFYEYFVSTEVAPAARKDLIRALSKAGYVIVKKSVGGCDE